MKYKKSMGNISCKKKNTKSNKKKNISTIKEEPINIENSFDEIQLSINEEFTEEDKKKEHIFDIFDRRTVKRMKPEENLSEKYVSSLTEFSIRCIDMKNDLKNHFHFSQFKKPTSDSAEKFKRLINEIKMLKRSLPLYFSNSIFLIYDKERMDVMKACIVGADNTPYSKILFKFFLINLNKMFNN